MVEKLKRNKLKNKQKFTFKFITSGRKLFSLLIYNKTNNHFCFVVHSLNQIKKHPYLDEKVPIQKEFSTCDSPNGIVSNNLLRVSI